jgi:hypothetical protein
MTNAIGTGTKNFTLNVPTDEHAELGRLAFRLGFRSVGDFMRHLVLKGLEKEDPQSATEIREIRRRYYGATLLGVFLLALAIGHDDARRTSRRVRVGRVIEERVEEI